MEDVGRAVSSSRDAHFDVNENRPFNASDTGVCIYRMYLNQESDRPYTAR
jgi:hypothetical protein